MKSGGRERVAPETAVVATEPDRRRPGRVRSRSPACDDHAIDRNFVDIVSVDNYNGVRIDRIMAVRAGPLQAAAVPRRCLLRVRHQGSLRRSATRPTGEEQTTMDDLDPPQAQCQ
jgi:hypothetical protein